MRSLRTLAGVALMTTAVACGDSDPRPPDHAPPGESITGRERIGWTQPAPGAGELALYRYAIYIDGTRSMLDGESCASTAGPVGFECSAPLPPVAPGRHTLELAVVVMADGTLLEGPRSAPLQINVAAGARAASAVAQDGPLVASDGLRFNSRILARDLNDPVDLGAAPDGRVFVAEREGHVRVAPGGSGAASAQNVLADLGAGRDAALVSLALAPDFERSGRVFIAYVETAGGGSVLRVARVREAGNLFGEVAVVGSYPVPPDADATIRVGPDGHLYVGVSTGSDAGSAQDLPSAGGKILRLDPDGRVPDGNPWRSPVYSVGHHDPRGLAWHPETGQLWELERNAAGDELNRIRAGANYGWPLVGGAQDHPFVTPPDLVLPPGTDASGLAAVSAPASPLFGDLIAAARGTGDLVRLRLDAAGHPRTTAHLLQGRFGSIAQVAAGQDGALYFITGTRAPAPDRLAADARGEELLVRLTATSTAVRRP